MRSLPPLSVRSLMKSQLYTWLTLSARVGMVPVEQPRRRGRFIHRLTRRSHSRRMRWTLLAPGRPAFLA